MSVALMEESLLDDVREGITMHLAPLNVEQYHQMIRDGILHDGAPIELIQGSLVYKDRRDKTGDIVTHGARHLLVLKRLTAILNRWVEGKTCHVQTQTPIIVSETSEPEPDCCLVCGTPEDYPDEVPHADDVLAVFEVAYSSLSTDRRTKQRLYAGAGIPYYVIVNLQENVVEFFSSPLLKEVRYATQATHQSGELVELRFDEAGTLQFLAADIL